MAKIVKDGLIFSGTPKEIVTAWPPTENGLEVELPTIGTTDISSVGDGTITGAINALSNSLLVLRGAWITSSTAGLNIKLTDTLTLPKGSYLLILTTPGVSSGTLSVGFGGLGSLNRYTTREYDNAIAYVENVAENSTVYGVSTGSAAVSYNYLERGGILAIRLKN